MTITLKPAALIALVAIIGILTGLAVGQIATANSEKASTSASSSRQVVSQLKQINNKLGANYKSTSALGYLSDIEQVLGDIEYNTEQTCAVLKDRIASC